MRDDDDIDVSRREVLLTGLVAAATTFGGFSGCRAAATGAEGTAAQRAAEIREKGGQMGSSNEHRMPVVYLPHGGGPWPFADLGFPQHELDALAGYLRALPELPRSTPKALLVISAHWEERVPTVTTSDAPPMLYDYYGFPPESYTVKWPAPGAPEVAENVRKLLEQAGFETAADPRRGFDHGTFVPLMLAYPAANVPTVQLSLKAGLDPAEHLAIGRALAPLRDQGVFIVGSGMSFHNMGAFRNPRAAVPHAKAFDDWLQRAGTAAEPERTRLLSAWASAPSAREAHPREEHLLPLMVIAGAAGKDPGSVPYRGELFGLPFSAYHYG